MKQHLPLQCLLLAATCALGPGSLVRADDSAVAAGGPAPVTANLSLLGLTHATLTYSRIDLDGTSVNADRYAFEINQALADGFDAVLGYDYLHTGSFAGSSVRSHTLVAALRAFSTSFNWGKPYAEAGIGHVWNRFGGADDNSLLWELGAGVEFQLAPRATVTPYVKYVDRPDLAAATGVWNFGVKGSYWIDQRWALTAGIERDDEQNTTFTVGTNFRY